MAIRRFVITIFVLLPYIVTSQGDNTNFMYLLDLIEEDKVAWVDAHNYFRRQVSNPSAANMRLMSWDDDLAKFAEKVVKTCSFFHTSVQDRRTKQFNPVGENLYTGGDYRFMEIMTHQGVTKLWYDEIQYHDINTLRCEAGKECGHYKQVIWATTYKVGCAIAKCRAVEGGHPPYLVSCNYGPIGNAYLNGKPLHPYLIGPPCSKCADGDICADKLCNKTGKIQPTVTTPMSTTILATTVLSTSSLSTSMTVPTTEGTTLMLTSNATNTPTTVPVSSTLLSSVFPTTRTAEGFQTTTSVPMVTTKYTTSSKVSLGVTTTGCSGKACPTMSTTITSRTIPNATETTAAYNFTMTAADAVRTSYTFNTILQVASIAWLVMVN